MAFGIFLASNILSNSSQSHLQAATHLLGNVGHNGRLKYIAGSTLNSFAFSNLFRNLKDSSQTIAPKRFNCSSHSCCLCIQCAFAELLVFSCMIVALDGILKSQFLPFSLSMQECIQPQKTEFIFFKET